MRRSGLVVLVIVWFLSGAAVAEEAPVGLQCLVDAYPDHLAGGVFDPEQGWMLRWKDGSTMDWDDGRGDKSFREKLDTPDLEDQMSIAYPAGVRKKPPGVDDDPGRIRFEPFFRKMYGDSPKEVEKHLVTVRWLPDGVARKLRPTGVNGVDQALVLVSAGLAELPARVRKVAESTSGPFNWRTIKGTKRLSVHSFAIGLDIGIDNSDYWKWNKPNSQGQFAYRNRIPLEIVEVFESHGFIWGGKWYHFDTMHFEYRPELLDKRCLRRQTP